MRFYFILFTLLDYYGLCAQQWQVPQIILDGLAQPSFIPAEQDKTSPVIKPIADQDGNLHLFWSDAYDGITDIFYSFKPKGMPTFSDPINLSNSMEQHSVFPEAILDPQQRLYVSWTEISEDYLSSQINARLLDINGNWSDIITISAPTDKLNLFSSSAYTDESKVFVTICSEIEIDDQGEVLTQELLTNKVDFNSGTVSNIDGPTISDAKYAFRPLLLNQGVDTIHCIWYDEIENNGVYTQYVTYSQFNQGQWSTPEPLSLETSNGLWDDGPLQLMLDANNNLYVLWTSFVPSPSNAQMAIKPAGENFQSSVIIAPEAIFNSVFYFDGQQKLNGVISFGKGLFYHKLTDDNNLTLKETIVAEFQNALNPAVCVSNDTAHLFWTQNLKMMYSKSPISTSSSTLESIQEHIDLLPNIASEMTYLRSSALTEKVEIYNIHGQMVQDKNDLSSAINNLIPLDISRLPSGVYIVKAYFKSGFVASHQLVIN